MLQYALCCTRLRAVGNQSHGEQHERPSESSWAFVLTGQVERTRHIQTGKCGEKWMTRQKWKLISEVNFTSHDSLTRNPKDFDDAYALLLLLL